MKSIIGRAALVAAATFFSATGWACVSGAGPYSTVDSEGGPLVASGAAVVVALPLDSNDLTNDEIGIAVEVSNGPGQTVAGEVEVLSRNLAVWRALDTLETGEAYSMVSSVRARPGGSPVLWT